MKTINQWRLLWEKQQNTGQSDFATLLKLLCMHMGYAEGEIARPDEEVYPSTNQKVTDNKNLLEILTPFLQSTGVVLEILATDKEEVPFEYPLQKAKLSDIQDYNDPTFQLTTKELQSIAVKCEVPSLQNFSYEQAQECYAKKNLTLSIERESKTYRIPGLISGIWQAPDFNCLVRKYQATDILQVLNTYMMTHRIEPYGDLARILQVASEKTDFSMDFKFTDFGLGHLVRIYKDARRSFKAWQGIDDFDYDLYQPWRGFKNFFQGLINCCLTPQIIISGIFNLLTEPNPENFMENGQQVIKETVLNLLDGICLMLAGIVQLVTIPLNCFIRMPLRSLITGDEFPLIEEGKAFKALFDTDKKSSENEVVDKLHVAYTHGLTQRKPTRKPVLEEQRLFQAQIDKRNRLPHQSEPEQNEYIAFMQRPPSSP